MCRHFRLCVPSNGNRAEFETEFINFFVVVKGKTSSEGKMRLPFKGIAPNFFL